MATWTVNSEALLRHAIEQSAAGDTILIAAGEYHIGSKVDGRFDIKIDKSLNIVGAGGRADIYSGGHKVEKGIFNLVLDKNETVTFDNIGFHGAHSWDANGSGIRQNGGNLVVKNSYFGTSDSGILSITQTPSKRGDVTVSHSEFNKIGTDGYSHAMYVLAHNFTVNNNNIHDTRYGHHVKSLSANTIVRDNILNDGAGTSSYAVEVSAGGDLLIEGNTIIQGINGDNRAVLSYSASRFGGSAGDVIVQNNVVKNLNGNANGSTLLHNHTDSEAQVLGNILSGFGTGTFLNGLYHQSGNKFDGLILESHGPNQGAITGTAGDDLLASNRTGPVDSLGGNDSVFGNIQGNLIFSGVGNDFIYGDDGKDRLYAGDGADILLGGLHDDRLFGQQGNDILFENSGVNTQWGGAGNDLIITRGKDLIHGGAGNDIIINNGGLSGKHVGGDGNDILFGGAGNQTLFGGDGHDIAIYNGAYADYALSNSYGSMLVKNIVGAGEDTGGMTESLTGIETIQFSNGYYDTATDTFKAGQHVIDLGKFNKAISVLETLTDSGIDAAPLSAVPVLAQVYVMLFGISHTIETSSALV